MSKTFIEDLMKSIVWTTACGAVYAMAMASLSAGDILKGLALFFMFTGLSVVALAYVAMHLVIPLDSAIHPTDPYWDEKAQGLKGIAKVLEAVKIFLTRKKFFYVVPCMGYFLYAQQVAKFVAQKAL